MTDDNEKIQKIAIMVDFYSDRADAHATLFLAFLFGLFTVLSIAQNENSPRTYWTIPYWLLFLGGLHSFLNFALYATYAQKITEEIRCYEVEEVRKVLNEVKRHHILGRFRSYKDWSARASAYCYSCLFYSCLSLLFVSYRMEWSNLGYCGICCYLRCLFLRRERKGRAERKKWFQTLK